MGLKGLVLVTPDVIELSFCDTLPLKVKVNFMTKKLKEKA